MNTVELRRLLFEVIAIVQETLGLRDMDFVSHHIVNDGATAMFKNSDGKLYKIEITEVKG